MDFEWIGKESPTYPAGYSTKAFSSTAWIIARGDLFPISNQ
jgi:hypothetical protein